MRHKINIKFPLWSQMCQAALVHKAQGHFHSQFLQATCQSVLGRDIEPPSGRVKIQLELT